MPLIDQELARIASVERDFRKALTEIISSPYREKLILNFQKKRKAKPNNIGKRAAVVGLGPTGIFASLEAYVNGFDVVAVESREKYTREQAFRFPLDSFEQWLEDYFGVANLEELEDDHPIKKIAKLGIFAKRKTRIDEGILFGSDSTQEQEHYEIAIKHLEHLFHSLAEMVSQVDPKAFELIHGHQFNGYSQENKSIQITPTRNSSGDNPIIIDGIDYLLGCDGLHSKTRERANIDVKFLSEKKKYIAAVFYQDTQQSSNPGCVSQFQSIKDDSFIDAQNDRFWPVRQNILFPPLPHKQQGACDEDRFHRLPAVRVFFTAIGAYIGVEVSHNNLRRLNEGQDSEEQVIERQCRAIMRIIFKVEPVRKFSSELMVQVQAHVLRKGKIFEIQLQEASCKYKKLDNGITYIPLGDANANAHFQTGSGALLGIQSAKSIVKRLGSPAEATIVEDTLKATAANFRAKMSQFYDVNQNVVDENNRSEKKDNTEVKLSGLIQNLEQKFSQLKTENKNLISWSNKLLQDITMHKQAYDKNPKEPQALNVFITKCTKSIDRFNCKKGISDYFDDCITWFLNGLKALWNVVSNNHRDYGKFFNQQKAQIEEVKLNFKSELNRWGDDGSTTVMRET